MSKFFFLLTVFLKATFIVDGIDVSHINYCLLKCGQEENSACKCMPIGHRSEDLTDLKLFRKRILEAHNDIRSGIASGREKFQYAGMASNMNVLSYNVELEYVARCYGLKYVFHQDRCRRTSRFESPGQVILRFERKQEIKQILELLMDLYSSQLKYFTNTTVERYEGHRGADGMHIEEAVEMIWWSHTHVGCARVYNPKPLLKADTYVVICNYGGLQKSNVVGSPVYRRGWPCSRCVNGGNCSTDFTKLCGMVEALPTDDVAPISADMSKIKENGVLLAVLICIICYMR